LVFWRKESFSSFISKDGRHAFGFLRSARNVREFGDFCFFVFWVAT